MGTTLTGTKPKDTYDSLIKVTDNGPISGTAKYLSDGLGNDSVLALSTASVGVGTTSPNIGTWNRALTLNAASGNAAYELAVAGAAQLYLAVDSTNAYLQVANASSPLSIYTGAAERMRITSTGVVELGQGQIKFPATQVASANANTLDDYEEGTWTPIVTFGGGSTGQVYSANQGTYTKIGRQVSVTCYVEFTNKGTSTGAGVLTGLPFTIGSGTGFFGAPSLGDVRNTTFIGILGFYSNQGQTTITMGQTSTLGAFTVLNETNFANNSEFILTATYFV